MREKNIDRPRRMITKLRMFQHQDAVLVVVGKNNRANPQKKLASQHLDLAGPRKPIFVSEELLPINKALHTATRVRAKEYNYKFMRVHSSVPSFGRMNTANLIYP
ncbi:hypothetical protein EVAR_48818_1 [Eumeta japonica]|uniref:Uncharacterized protein n=1 Tax=Eumeta variegata TaxID=151549 RepID=A0A4C1Y1S5_EUMVA|nr:hypothetical protein EVAR_48818_1 [Eumeta japonica]